MTNSESSKDLKQMAMKYYEENKVPVQMENVLNTMFFENPSDVYGYLVSARLLIMYYYSNNDYYSVGTAHLDTFCDCRKVNIACKCIQNI